MSDPLDHRQRLYARYRSDQGWDPGFDDRAPRKAGLDRLARLYLPADRRARILDLGCGSGTLVDHLRRKGYGSVTGVDAAGEQIAAGSGRGIEGLTEEDLLAFVRRQPDGSWDTVVAWDVLEHLDKGELLTLLDEVHRTLGAGGRLVLHAPNAESPFGSRMRYADFTHEQAFTRESLGQVLRAAGFRRLSVHEDDPVVHGAASALRFLLWKLIRGLLRLYTAAETGSPGRECVFTQNLIGVAWRD